ncbi:MAG: response regulator transcription factor [Tissierellia bacterium]|nr:response regulator transcription factor [Tissierellia bacterium]
MKGNILVVDDHQEILDIISYHLTKEGYSVLKATNSDEALEMLSKSSISAGILDIMMPEMDGISLCKIIRDDYFFPIMFLTAKGSETDKLEGLACGADDYMVKPFSAVELVARVKSMIRRSTIYNIQNSDLIKIGKMEYDKMTGVIKVNGKPLNLTDLEYRILILLIHKRGETVTGEEIFSTVWGYDYCESANNNIVVHIRNLRRKLSKLDKETNYISTVWGKGYIIYD